MRSQRGQILVLCLMLAWVGAAALWFVFDAGQLVGAKARTVTAADTAAWSAATWRARVLNYSAYSNRAIVAQEVAVAQAITLESWAYYFETFTKSIEEISRVYPPAYAIASVVAEAAELSREATELAAAAEIRLRDAPEYGYKTLLAHSQRVMHYTASNFGLSAVAHEVAQTADKRIKAYVLPVGTTHDKFVTHYASDEQRERLRDVVERSLDRFTSGSRDADFILGPGLCLVTGSSTDDRFVTYRKRGGTKLAPGLDRWEAADTGSIQAPTMGGGLFGLGGKCGHIELYTLGWGASEIFSSKRRNEIVSNPGDVRANRRALSEAEDGMSESGRYEHHGTGIARVFDLNYAELDNSRYPISRVLVLAKLPQKDMRIGSILAEDKHELTSDLALNNKQMRALGAAEVYFKRPPTDPDRLEYASLYNPFWQVRLSAATPEEREIANHAP